MAPKSSSDLMNDPSASSQGSVGLDDPAHPTIPPTGNGTVPPQADLPAGGTSAAVDVQVQRVVLHSTQTGAVAGEALIVRIGSIYKLEGYIDGNPVTYIGKANEIKVRVGGSGHPYAKLVKDPKTTVSMKKAYGKLNVEASGRANIRSAQNEALLSQEEKALRQTESEVAEANKNLAPGQAPRTILNKNRPAAGENMAEWEARHSASSDAEWEVIKTPGSSVIVFRVFVGVQVLQLILEAVFAKRNAKMARYTWAPYVFIEENDPESSFTVDGETSWLGLVTTWSKHYITGKHTGAKVEITDDQYKALKDEAEALYGYVDFWADFVPGLLRTELPVIDHDPNDPHWA
jgi:hypothetical protein